VPDEEPGDGPNGAGDVHPSSPHLSPAWKRPSAQQGARMSAGGASQADTYQVTAAMMAKPGGGRQTRRSLS
jgi:hypothetical protein